MSVGYRRCSEKLVSIMAEAGTEHSLRAGGLLWNDVCLAILGMSFGVLYFWVNDGEEGELFLLGSKTRLHAAENLLGAA